MHVHVVFHPDLRVVVVNVRCAGEVRIGTWNHDGRSEMVRVETIAAAPSEKEGLGPCIPEICDALGHIKHASILPLRAIVVEMVRRNYSGICGKPYSHLALVTALPPHHVTLASYLQQHPALSLRTCLQFLLQVAEALEYLHNWTDPITKWMVRIPHLSFELDQLLVSKQDGRPRVHVTIPDFGYVRYPLLESRYANGQREQVGACHVHS
jgi:hypothetical protein